MGVGVRGGAGFCPVGGKGRGAAGPGTGGLQASGLSEHPAWSSLAGSDGRGRAGLAHPGAGARPDGARIS